MRSEQHGLDTGAEQDGSTGHPALLPPCVVADGTCPTAEPCRSQGAARGGRGRRGGDSIVHGRGSERESEEEAGGEQRIEERRIEESGEEARVLGGRSEIRGGRLGEEGGAGIKGARRKMSGIRSRGADKRAAAVSTGKFTTCCEC